MTRNEQVKNSNLNQSVLPAKEGTLLMRLAASLTLRRAISRAVLVKSAILVTTFAAVAMIPTPANADDQVPIQAKFGTRFTFVGIPNDQCNVRVPVTGVGQVSHLGNSTTTIDQIVDLCQTPSPQKNGVILITAANGDTLSGTFTGFGTVDPTTGFLTAAGKIVFTNGTGRYQGAKGDANFDVVANVFVGQGVFTFSGTISSPGSLHQ